MTILGVVAVAACGQDTRGAFDSGDVTVFTCTPGETACEAREHYRCGADGMSREEVVDCPAACDALSGCVACVPESRVCDGDTSLVCTTDGSGFRFARDCAESGSVCEASGYCGDACGAAELTRSSVGCEYWPPPLSTKNFGDIFDFRAVVSNPNAAPVNVRVLSGDALIAEVAIPEGSVQDIPLPWVEPQSGGLRSLRHRGLRPPGEPDAAP